MATPLHAGGLDLEIALYTCEQTFYEPAEWVQDGGRHTCKRLVNGTGGEAIASPSGEVVVETWATESGPPRLQITCGHEAAIKGMKIAFEVPYMPMLAPEEAELAPYVWREHHYPRDWRTGFAVWRAGERFFTIGTEDVPWRFKRLRTLRMEDRLRIEIVQDESLRRRTRRFESSVWQIGYRNEIDAWLNEYGRFAQQAFGALDWERRRDMPDWVRQIALVVNLHGTDWNGRTNLDFAGMQAAAHLLAEQFPPAQTLLYPIGWDGRYMRNYPDYLPPPGLGGHEGFQQFCRQAREAGFHIMPHLNAMAINMRHPLYLQHLKDYALRDWNGVLQHSFKIDWDHDGLGDPAHAYIALEPPALREILVDTIERLVRDYGIDAVFLDETCNVFYNDPAWDQVEGVRRLVRDIHQAHPELLVAGEEWNELLLGLTPVVQLWEETADGRGGFGRCKSPLMRRWAGQFIRGCGYLALASPDGQTGVHEWPDKPWVDERENEAFYIPTLSITGATLERGREGIAATIERAKRYAAEFLPTSENA